MWRNTPLSHAFLAYTVADLLQYIDAVQQDTQSVLMSEFIRHLSYLDVFRTSSVHHQEHFVQAVFADFGMW